ncbi:MAG: cysteine desulfurase-like protein [Bacteroidota bacterium]
MNQAFISQFPALKRKVNDKTLVFLDGPGGTQVPTPVIDSISHYYENSNANSHGPFITSQETDDVIEGARERMADLLGAEGSHNISFGANMTSLAYSLSRAIGRMLRPGDEIIITQLDHEANRGPWLALREQGIIVKEIWLKDDGTLDYEQLVVHMNHRTRMVAMGWASNILGTVNDVKKVRRITHRHNAWLLLDAVHYAPHFPIDVAEIGCDFLLCSAYKFYGPHVGILYSKTGLLDRLPTDRLRTADQHAPYSIETGTQNHAAFAGVYATIDFLASFGKGETRREKLLNTMLSIRHYERELFMKFCKEISKIRDITILGLPPKAENRTPTLAITFRNKKPQLICEKLAANNICAWHGHFYAVRAVEILGLAEHGGVTRLGLSAYSTENDCDRTIEVLKSLSTRPTSLIFHSTDNSPTE